MPQHCERPLCREIATVEYSMNAQALLVTLENYAQVGNERRNCLCMKHADRLSVPRGWSIDDRRESVPRLFRPPAPVKVQRDATPASGQRRKSRGDAVRPKLFDREVAQEPAPTPPAPAPAQVDDWEVRDDGLEETQAMQWKPSFDHTDDLGGILRPKGKLMSRAFGMDDTFSAPRPTPEVNDDELEREPFNENDIP
ncbi:MAG: DUF3499 family protein [Actinobacteria bacterium]|nr:DUF3499 family protein [Actinomycetota bacterium]